MLRHWASQPFNGGCERERSNKEQLFYCVVTRGENKWAIQDQYQITPIEMVQKWHVSQ